MSTETQRCNFKGCDEGAFVDDAMKCDECSETMCPVHIRGLETPDSDGWLCTNCVAAAIVSNPDAKMNVYPFAKERRILMRSGSSIATLERERDEALRSLGQAVMADAEHLEIQQESERLREAQREIRTHCLGMHSVLDGEIRGLESTGMATDQTHAGNLRIAFRSLVRVEALAADRPLVERPKQEWCKTFGGLYDADKGCCMCSPGKGCYAADRENPCVAAGYHVCAPFCGNKSIAADRDQAERDAHGG